jgi:hypothetical protein
LTFILNKKRKNHSKEAKVDQPTLGEQTDLINEWWNQIVDTYCKEELKAQSFLIQGKKEQ